MTRHIIIAIPPTTDYTVVFPHDALAKRFDTGFYSPALTDGRASREEIEQVLREVEAVRKPFASKIVSAVCCYILSLFAAIGGFIFLMISVGSSHATDMIPFYMGRVKLKPVKSEKTQKKIYASLKPVNFYIIQINRDNMF